MIISEDTILGGRVWLRQARAGYRAGLDAALLAAACDAAAGARVLDVGCGAGAVMLAAATRRDATLFVGLERDGDAAILARQNIALNELGQRIVVIEGDATARFSTLGLAPFDAVLSNPPFFDNSEALRGPAEAKRDAWIVPEGIAAWIEFMLKATRSGGTLTLIHRTDRLADILAALSSKAGSIQIRPIQPFTDAPAKRVLVRAIKTGKAPLRILPALVAHERGGMKHAADVEAILRGEGDIAWL